MKKVVLLFLFCCVTSVTSLAQSAPSLTYMTEEFRPFNFKENRELKGISVELLHLMWKKMSVPAQPIKLYPWARGYDFVQTKPKHMLFTMGKTKERENLFKWVGPILVIRQNLYALKKNNIKLKSIDEGKQYQVGAIREDVGEQLLKKAGYDRSTLQITSSVESNIRKLVRGRIKLFCYTESGFNRYVKQLKFDPNDFMIAFTVDELGTYYAFHKETPDQLINQFQTALNGLQKEKNAIIEKYGQ